jgi:hypothetical protein
MRLEVIQDRYLPMTKEASISSWKYSDFGVPSGKTTLEVREPNSAAAAACGQGIVDP